MKKCHSVLTDNLTVSYISGGAPVAIHHVFNGSRKGASELYGFLAPLTPWEHQHGPDSVHMAPNKGIDLKLKQECQRYFEEHYGCRMEFIDIFGRSYLE